MAHTGAPVAVLLATAPPLEPALQAQLGPRRAAALQEELTKQAMAWARQLTGAQLATADPDRSLADQIARHAAGPDRAWPLVVIWPVLPRPRRQDGEGALEDLRTGADLVLGPMMDGGLYLLGLAKAAPEILANLERAWDHEDAMPLALAATRDDGLEVGVLRVERALRRQADAEAALADPLLPDEVARILRAG
jgi:glycosyltransferase A (GT-A) superfamily protein (DUF2064 family)